MSGDPANGICSTRRAAPVSHRNASVAALSGRGAAPNPLGVTSEAFSQPIAAVR